MTDNIYRKSLKMLESWLRNYIYYFFRRIKTLKLDFVFCFNYIHSMYLPNPSARTGYETMLILKRCLTGLYSKFSFSWTGCLTKTKEPSPPYYLSISGENNWIHTFPKGLRAIWNSLVEDLNSCRCVHFRRWHPLHHDTIYGNLAKKYNKME